MGNDERHSGCLIFASLNFKVGLNNFFLKILSEYEEIAKEFAPAGKLPVHKQQSEKMLNLNHMRFAMIPISAGLVMRNLPNVTAAPSPVMVH